MQMQQKSVKTGTWIIIIIIITPDNGILDKIFRDFNFRVWDIFIKVVHNFNKPYSFLFPLFLKQFLFFALLSRNLTFFSGFRLN